MSSSKRSWVGVVFGLVFFFAGMAVAYHTAFRAVITHVNSVDWEMVSATIEDLEFKRHRGSESTTYSVRGRYTYYYNGSDYSSTRISFSEGSDNFGDYWQDLYARLNQDRRFESAMAWVNPNNPSEAVLDRTLRWSSIGFGAVFAIIFGGVGGFVAWGAWRKESSPSHRSLMNSTTGISSKEKSGGIALLLFGCVFFGVGSIMSAMMLPKELADKNYPALLMLVFVIVGLGIMVTAIKHIMSYRRFGPTPLFLDPSAPGVGGEFGARFVLGTKKLTNGLLEQADATATLCCLRNYTSGDDTKVEVLWKHSSPVYAHLGSAGLNAECKFNLPENTQPTRGWSNRSSIDWELSVEGDFSAQGLGLFRRSWEVYIGDTPSAVASQITMPKVFLDRAQASAEQKSTLSALRQIKLTDNGYEFELLSAAGRHWVTGIVGILFGCVFAGVGVFTIEKDWWPGYIFLAVGVIVALSSLFTVGRSVRARFDKQARIVKLQRSWAGVVFSSAECSLLDASQFSIKSTSSVGQGSKGKEYFSLYIENNGRKHKVAEAIEGNDAASALMRELETRLF